MLTKLETKQININSCIIPYHELEKKINNEFFRKYFIIDIRNMTDNKINNVFNNFDEFNYQLLEKTFFSNEVNIENFDYRKNMIVLFLYSKDKKYNIDKNKILYDMRFALKKFVTEEELTDILCKSSIELSCTKKVYFTNDSISVFSGFNLLHGLNGSGKTYLLNKISNHCNVPIFNMDTYNLDLIEQIKDYSLVEKYLQKLNELNRYKEKTDTMNYLSRLSQILAFSKEQKNIVLLDNLCWGSLDDRNRINVLDTLFDYSCDNSSSVVVTSCQDDVKRLVKNRIYSSNIIEVNRK